MRAGDCSLPWEPELVSPCFTFYSIGQGRVVFLVFVCCFGVLFALFFLVPDLSFWSRCLTMTILAQPNDCHSCNDARSIVQKKKVWQKSLIGASRVQAWHQEESDSLPSSARCQTSCIPPKLTQDGIPPTMTTEGGYGRLHLYTRCISCTWSRASLDHGPQNPLGILLTVHIGVSRGPQTLCPLCLWRQNINHYTGRTTDICQW